MSYPTNKAKYPIIERDPTFAQVVAAYRSSDWQIVALATAASAPFGYWAGRPVLMRPSMYVCASLGTLFGLTLGFQSTFARLTGYKENSVELAKYATPHPAESSAS